MLNPNDVNGGTQNNNTSKMFYSLLCFVFNYFKGFIGINLIIIHRISEELRDKWLKNETQIGEQSDERLTMNDNKRYYRLILIHKYFNEIIIHNYSSSRMKVYAKKSFDRFGDDLTELILQYLTLEDKIRLECVSKQWQRLIYNKVFVIEIDINSSNRIIKSELKLQHLESLLKKCPNITKAGLRNIVNNNSSVLSLIGRYCHRIKSLSYWPDFAKVDDMSLSFFRMYGHKLEELRIYGNSEELEMTFKHCPNLKKVNYYDNSNLHDNDKPYLRKLEQFDHTFSLNPEYVNIFKILSDKYSQNIKTLNVELYHLKTEELKTYTDCISQFENLKVLKCEFSSMKTSQPIDDCLSLIGQKCNKLLKLDLSISPSVPISERFLTIFTKFKTIKKLKTKLPQNRVLSGSVECFKHCKQLKKLHIQYPKLTEDFFANIASFVPKLQSLRITTKTQFSKSFVDSFPPMISMQKLNFTLLGENSSIVYQKSRHFGKSYSKQKIEKFYLCQFPGKSRPYWKFPRIRKMEEIF